MEIAVRQHLTKYPSLPGDAISAEDVVRAYKSLGNVEQAFRTLKGVDILVRPIHHRLNGRVKAHIFLCMLTYYIEWHMRRALSPLMYAEDDFSAARAARDPVAKAGPTAEARRKRATGKSAGGTHDLRTWRGLMAALGTLCRTTVKIGNVPVVMDAKPTDFQAEAFRLLAAESPTWNRECSQ